MPLKCFAMYLAADGALLVVAAAGAERVPEALLGELGVGRGRGDLQHAVLVVDGRGRDRDAGVEVAHHVLHAVADELVGDRDALLRVGHVVADLEGDLVAEDAALGVEVVDGLLGALLELGAEGGVGAGDRPGDAELEVGRVGERRRRRDPPPARNPSIRKSSRVHLPASGSGRAGRRGRGGFDANVLPESSPHLRRADETGPVRGPSSASAVPRRGRIWRVPRGRVRDVLGPGRRSPRRHRQPIVKVSRLPMQCPALLASTCEISASARFV